MASSSADTETGVWKSSPLAEESGKPHVWDCERLFRDMEEDMSSKDTSSIRKDQSISNKEAVIVVNGMIPDDHKFTNFWRVSHVRVCADGGANRLYYFDKDKYKPEYIVGDLDSIKPEILDYYNSRGVTIVKSIEQESTDLQKALHLVKKIETQPSIKYGSIIVLGGLGGCISQQIGNINSLYHHPSIRMFLVSKANAAMLLHKGKHIIKIASVNPPKEDGEEDFSINRNWTYPSTVFCSLTPLGHPIQSVTTKGLRWNLDNQSLAFGGRISTSNEVLHNIVEIEVSHPLLWAFDFRSDSWCM